MRPNQRCVALMLRRLFGRPRGQRRSISLAAALDIPQRRPLAYESMLEQAARTSPRFVVLSGCQAPMIAGFLETLTLGIADSHFLSLPKVAGFGDGEWQRYQSELDATDYIYTQKLKVAEALRAMPQYREKVRYFPVIGSAALHPDISYMRCNDERYVGPMGDYHSVLATAAYFAGLTEHQALACFSPEVYQAIGFIDKAHQERTVFLKRFAQHGIDLSESLKQWEQLGGWMRTLNHPNRRVVYDVVVKALQRDGIPVINSAPAAMDWVDDDLARSAEWPVYPGLNGESIEDISSARDRMIFKSPYKQDGRSLFLNLEQLIGFTYESLAGKSRGEITLRNFDLDQAIEAVSQV